MFKIVQKAYDTIVDRDTLIWRGCFYGSMWMTAVCFVGMSLGMPTGMGIWFDVPVITIVVTLLVYVGSILGAGLLWLVRLPIPRLFTSGLLCSFMTISLSLNQFNLEYAGAAFITGLSLVLGVLIGTSSTFLMISVQVNWRHIFYVCFSWGLFIFFIVWLLSPGKEFYSTVQPNDYRENPLYTIQVEDPSQPGDYEIHAFTYGSGEDLHREEFSDEVDFITESVDASALITEWHVLRDLFWGFDETNIPLNGRVWMPEGEGPFPLVVMVHGSHKMENFSDEGYDYLGELLASRGFIAISISQNFVNFSVWSEGIDRDMTTRAWVLLQHVIMLEQANQNEKSPFYNKIEMEKIALIGHSRGGQAAVLVAEFDQFYNKALDEEISLDVNFEIRSVVAIAPVDWLVEDRWVKMKDVDYLVIQGSQDSDVNTFYGDRHYRRTTFNEREDGFKASVYIEGANHGQFNTDWGDNDTTMPTALLLNKKDMMDGDEQRQIAMVYVSAFLEASLNEKHEYLPILRDYRTALKWLPDTVYINRFEDASFYLVSDYEEDRNLETMRRPGLFWQGKDLSLWEESLVMNRMDHSTHNRAVKLEWNGRGEASYTLTLTEDFVKHSQLEDAYFTFSLANADLMRLYRQTPFPRVSIEMVMNNGDNKRIVVKRPLSDYRAYPPVIHSRFTKLGIFEETVKLGDLGHSAEPIFQLYEIPMADFIFEAELKDETENQEEVENEEEMERANKVQGEADANANADDEVDTSVVVQQIRVIFERGAAGKLYIDDVGFSW